MSNFANTKYPYEMQHNAAFHQGIPLFVKVKKIIRQKNTLLLQTVKAQMKCSIMLYFIWVYTVCRGKKNPQTKEYNLF